MIRLNNVRKTYVTGDVSTAALNGISLEIEDGAYISIMGTSGSGKSTLLNILGGMDRLTEGEYFYNDIAVHELLMYRSKTFLNSSLYVKSKVSKSDTFFS